MNPKPDQKNPYLSSCSYCSYGVQRPGLHSMHKPIHNNIQVLQSLFMDHINQLTGNGMSYLIIDKISNTIEKEIV